MTSAIKKMFGEISQTYDIANDFLTFGLHRKWKNLVIKCSELGSADYLLDLCAGTGDLAIKAYEHHGSSCCVVAADFSQQMLTCAKNKFRESKITLGRYPIAFICSDAEKLPFKDAQFDRVVLGYGIRNIEDTALALNEIKRVLKDQGKLVILETGQPELPIIAQLYSLYSFLFIPIIGWIISKNWKAYKYLPRTSKKFPYGRRFTDLLKTTGFSNVESKSLIFGVSYIYQATKS